MRESLKAINPHLDWPKEQSVGTHIDVSHEAATPPGLEVTATVELIAVEGKRLLFAVEAHDGIDLISKGRHERFVINKEKLDARVGKRQPVHNVALNGPTQITAQTGGVPPEIDNKSRQSTADWRRHASR